MSLEEKDLKKFAPFYTLINRIIFFNEKSTFLQDVDAPVIGPSLEDFKQHGNPVFIDIN